MYVMSITAFLERYGAGNRKLEPHGALRRQQLVREWDGASEVLFVSHEWMGTDHPDPDGQQTAALCTFLDRLRSGIERSEGSWEYQLLAKRHSAKRVLGGRVGAVRAAEWKRRLVTAHIWLDYVSAPQPRAPDDGHGCETPIRPQPKCSGPFYSPPLSPCAGPSQMEELNAAISSIPSYIARCSIFVVFAPTCVPASSPTVATSYVTWRRRGWTRFEYLLAKLSAVPKICLVVRSGSAAPVLDFPLDCFKLIPGEGEFSCCRLNHTLNDMPVECDKPKLRVVLDRVVMEKAKALRDQGMERDWRFYFSLRNYFSRGLGVGPRVSELGTCRNAQTMEGVTSENSEESDQVGSLRRSLLWNDSDDAAGELSGWTLLKFAVLSDDVSAVKALLCHAEASKSAVRIDQPLRMGGPEVGMLPKLTNLHLAMMLASPPVVKLLLDAHADAFALDSFMGCTPLHLGCANGQVDNVKCFLDALPDYDIDITAIRGGQSPLHWSAYLAPFPKQRSLMRMLVDRGASPFLTSKHGRTLLHSVCLSEDCDATLVPEVLGWYAASQPRHAQEAQRGLGVDSRLIPVTVRWAVIFKVYCAISRLGSRSNLAKYFAITYKATPLHLAIFRNDHFAVSALSEAGANPGIVNASGYDAAALSQQLWGASALQELIHAEDPRVCKSGAVYCAKVAAQAMSPSRFGGRRGANPVQVAPAPNGVGT